MKILMINPVCGIRSTGRICTDLSNALEDNGYDVRIAYGRDNVPIQYTRKAVRIGYQMTPYAHALYSRILDAEGLGSKHATVRFIEWIEEYEPDIIHLHNLHGHYINYPVLFDYLKHFRGDIIWTLHDCWPFTGHCTNFESCGCMKWVTGCFNCEQRKSFPKSMLFDKSRRNYELKKKYFTQLERLTIVTPSKWLAELVRQSFLGSYDIQVIHNGINTGIFKPTPSLFRENHGVGKDTKMLLGVASFWGFSKGLDTFLKLYELLDPAIYRIVLVGLNEEQITSLPNGIIGVCRTNSVQELAEIYSAADLFINPTLEDNYPTTNLEAIACGTPVITFDTGGSGESAKHYGEVVEKGNIDMLVKSIKKCGPFEYQPFKISVEDALAEYISLYEKIIGK